MQISGSSSAAASRDWSTIFISSGLPMNLADVVENSESVKDFAKNLAVNTAMDAGLGGVIGGVHLLKGIDETKLKSVVVKSKAGKKLDVDEAKELNKFRENAKAATNSKTEKKTMSVTSGGQSPNTLLSAAKSPSVNNIPKSTANGNTKTTYLRRESHKFGGIKRGESDKIEQLTEKNVDGYTHSIGINDLEHIERRYGIKGQADHTMADVNDIGRIRYVVENYDNIKRTVNDKGKLQFTNAYLDKEMKPVPLITYEKRVDGHVYVVEAVADTSKKEVRVLSAYMNTEKKRKSPVYGKYRCPCLDVR